VLLDQRGSGRSSPLGEVKYNRLELLVKDVEMLRLHLIKEKLISSCFDNDEESEQKSNSATQSPQHNHHPWDVILGGSWGCTLAMAYAHTYPNSVRAMVLRGLCLFRKREIDWLFGNPPKLSVTIATNDMRRTSNLRDLVAGKSSSSVSMAQSVATVAKSTNVEKQSVAAQFFPQQWKDFSSAVEHDEKNNSRSVLHAYYHLLLGTDVQKKYQALTPWFRWEMGIYGNGFKTSQENEDKNRLLVWYPSSASWKCEDARVKSRKSVDSINVIDVPNNTRDDILRSLRRFYTSSSDASLDVDEKLFEPLPVENTQAAESGQETEINMPDNATINFIPAQAMLTCYYSVNGDYCIQPYNSFLSLNPPPSIPFSSWYSSELPPSSSCESSISSYSSFPLPPTIAIQGGNDAICPPDTALDLHKVWKQLELRLALAGGHSMYDPVIAGEIVKSLDRFGHALMRGGDHTMYDETQATQDTQ
jgi:pimeloyl-ACP methyl ester carboxylesterase